MMDGAVAKGIKPLGPPLKWAGGKRWLKPYLEFLVGDIQDHQLVEPFAGGLSVAFGLRPKKALLNDVNPHLINFYQWLQAGLRLTINTSRTKENYLRNRNDFNKLIRNGEADSRRAAMLFFYLNRSCFNGLCRFNKAGEFNVPRGFYGKKNVQKDLRKYAAVLAPWSFSCIDFRDLDYGDDALLYVDPPYDDAFNDYAANGFSWEDQKAVAEIYRQHDGPVILSNHATPRLIRLYKSLGYKLYYIPAPRMINANGNRANALELLATRNLGTSLPAQKIDLFLESLRTGDPEDRFAWKITELQAEAQKIFKDEQIIVGG